jgi:acyl phosphate:glycerol-3-phosphate acyltransferase
MTTSLAQYFPWMGVLIAYLLGSIPTSYLIGRIFFHTDIRQTGSGNIGATNALRTLGTGAGLIVLAFDVFKGVAAVLIGKAMAGSLTNIYQVHWLVSLCALAVIAGHVFSIFLKFKGGKGVATTAGGFFILQPFSMLFCLVFFIFVVFNTKYVSLGSMLAAFAMLAIELVTQIIMKFPNLPLLIVTAVVFAIVIQRHRQNVKRLIAGCENKISFRKKQIS